MRALVKYYRKPARVNGRKTNLDVTSEPLYTVFASVRYRSRSRTPMDEGEDVKDVLLLSHEPLLNSDNEPDILNCLVTVEGDTKVYSVESVPSVGARLGGGVNQNVRAVQGVS